jgi:DNA processing protein
LGRMNARIVLLHLSLIDGVGPATIAKIVAVLAYDDAAWCALYTMMVSALADRFQLTRAVAQKIEIGLQNNTLLMAELELIRVHAINWVTVLDQEYPALLRFIHTPPAVLYWRGSCLHDVSSQTIAIVGSRRANHYGQRVINKLVPQLVERDYTIVSGGAVGADTMAHRAAVDRKGKTIVVLGSGLLKVYPQVNIPLFQDVVATGGAVVSIFPLTMEALPGNFPARNRVIAGLSKACIVVQAAARSGAAITATYALEQGRDVFAVPGPIDDELSIGCHALIKEGATLLSDISDIIGNLQDQAMITQSVLPSAEISDHALRAAIEPSEPRDPLLCLCDIPRSVDELVLLSGASFTVVQDKLFELQLDGLVTQDFTGMWITR